MSTVQRIPGGLLELLGAKTSGYTLTGLRDEISPSIDIATLMGLGLPLETIEVSDAAAAEGSAIQIVVPPTEWWMLYAASGQFTSTTTGTFVFSLRISSNTDSTQTVALARMTSGLAIAAVYMAAAIFVPPAGWMILPPNTILWHVVDLLGVDATCSHSMNARIARLT